MITHISLRYLIDGGEQILILSEGRIKQWGLYTSIKLFGPYLQSKFWAHEKNEHINV